MSLARSLLPLNLNPSIPGSDRNSMSSPPPGKKRKEEEYSGSKDESWSKSLLRWRTELRSSAREKVKKEKKNAFLYGEHVAD